MQGTNPATGILRESISQAVELVPAARDDYAADNLDETLETLREAKKAARRDAAALRKQAAALLEEAGEIDDAIKVLGRGILALELCDTNDPSYQTKASKAA